MISSTRSLVLINAIATNLFDLWGTVVFLLAAPLQGTRKGRGNSCLCCTEVAFGGSAFMLERRSWGDKAAVLQ